MDNSEIHYLTYDPDRIWDEMMTQYVKAGGDILYPGDEKEMLLRSVLADIVLVFAGVDNGMRMQTLRYATGEYLDLIGEQRGCPRIEASAARTSVMITTNATGEPGMLRAGTAMTSDGEIFYLLTEDLPLTGYAQTFTAEVTADRAGSIGNGLLAGTQMTLAVTDSNVNKIVAAEDAGGGNEREDDESYRERIRVYNITSLTTGPAQQYEAVAKSVSSVILDAKAVNLEAGRVGVYLILANDIGSDAILKSVEAALSAETVRPLTDSVKVYKASDIPYTLNVEYYCDNSSATNAAVAEAAKEYQNWQDGGLGRAFNPDRLMASIYQAGAMRVVWGEGSHFNADGPVTYTEIEGTQRCKGTITLKASKAF